MAGNEPTPQDRLVMFIVTVCKAGQGEGLFMAMREGGITPDMFTPTNPPARTLVQTFWDAKGKLSWAGVLPKGNPQVVAYVNSVNNELSGLGDSLPDVLTAFVTAYRVRSKKASLLQAARVASKKGVTEAELDAATEQVKTHGPSRRCKLVSMADTEAESDELLANLQAGRRGYGEIPWGFPSFVFNGMTRGGLYGLMGPTGCGKTAGLTEIGDRAAFAGYNVVYLNLEMIHMDWEMRRVSAYSGITRESLYNTSADYEAYKAARQQVAALPVRYNQAVSMNFNELIEYFHEGVFALGQVDLFIIDYPKLLEGPSERNPIEHANTVARFLKLLAVNEFVNPNGLKAAVLVALEINRDMQRTGRPYYYEDDVMYGGAYAFDGILGLTNPVRLIEQGFERTVQDFLDKRATQKHKPAYLPRYIDDIEPYDRWLTPAKMRHGPSGIRYMSYGMEYHDSITKMQDKGDVNGLVVSHDTTPQRSSNFNDFDMEAF